jgi:hypothetical protein
MQNINYHILNGDVLADRLPKEIEGNKIIFREAFISGPVTISGHELDFWLNRQRYFTESFQWEDAEYYAKIMVELFKIRKIRNDAEVNIWLEPDLHCYTNLWFLCHLIKDKFPDLKVNFIIPEKSSAFGFEGMIDEELLDSYQLRENMNETIVGELSQCWEAYCLKDHKRLAKYGNGLKSYIIHIDKIIEAHLSRIESVDAETKPIKTLKTLIKELGACNYETLFWEFTKREGFYGYRELEFKQLYDKAITLC